MRREHVINLWCFRKSDNFLFEVNKPSVICINVDGSPNPDSQTTLYFSAVYNTRFEIHVWSFHTTIFVGVSDSVAPTQHSPGQTVLTKPKKSCQLTYHHWIKPVSRIKLQKTKKSQDLSMHANQTHLNILI